MKEMEKLVLLRMLRKEREAPEKITESIKDPETKEIFRQAASKTNNPKDKVSMLDTIISDNYNCKHEYGLHNSSDKFMDKDCVCLDCGEYLDRKDIGIIYETNHSMNLVRNAYLELIQQMSICDSVTTLQQEYQLKRHI